MIKKYILQSTAAQEEVRTTLLIDGVLADALSTAKVPSTAGPITSSSRLGLFKGKGEATWMTKSIPCTAL